MNNQKKPNGPPLYVFIEMLWTLFIFGFRAFFCGLNTIIKRQKGKLFQNILFLIILANLSIHKWHLKLISWIIPAIRENALYEWIYYLHPLDGFVFTAFLYFFLRCFFSGASTLLEVKRYQKSLERIVKKTNQGYLKVLKVTKTIPTKTLVEVSTNLLGIDDFTKNTQRLSSSFHRIVDSIKEGNTPGNFLLHLSANRLAKKYSYQQLKSNLTTSESFIVGQSGTGIVRQNLSELPHLLIAGTTGGGKSVFFKQTLLSLLESSRLIKMYLIDLKGGVEMQVFEKLPNVKMVSDLDGTITILKQVKKEKDDRFAYLKDTGRKEINPRKDGKERIIIGIDESSMLYAPRLGEPEEQAKVLQARILIDEIAKLGRAAAISLILSTQKVSKKTIDTSIQHNVEGKMCFRVNTLQGSAVVLGNKSAYMLPNIPGRGIWQVGNKEVEVQTPFLSEEELEESLDFLVTKFSKNKKEYEKENEDIQIHENINAKRMKMDKEDKTV